MAYIEIQTPPAAEPLLLADVKNFLKISPAVTADDGYVADLIQAAREEVEGFTGRSIVNKLYCQVLDSFPYFVDSTMSQNAYPPSQYAMPRYSTTLWNYSQMIKLLRSPLREVERIDYVDSKTSQVLSLLPAPDPWLADTEYAIGDEVQDSNGNLQEVTAITSKQKDGTSISGATTPTWATGITATTADGDLTWANQGVAPSGDFIADAVSCPARIFPLRGQTWPSVLYVPNAVRIRFIAGYGNDGAAAPAVMRQAMRLIISDAYFNRESAVSGSVTENPALRRLLWRFRVSLLNPTQG